MGIFSNWFGSSSASSSGGAGKIEAPRNAQGPPAAAGGSSKSNVWRSVFDPGSNPNIDKVGSSYYDTVHKVIVKVGGGGYRVEMGLRACEGDVVSQIVRQERE